MFLWIHISFPQLEASLEKHLLFWAVIPSCAVHHSYANYYSRNPMFDSHQEQMYCIAHVVLSLDSAGSLRQTSFNYLSLF